MNEQLLNLIKQARDNMREGYSIMVPVVTDGVGFAEYGHLLEASYFDLKGAIDKVNEFIEKTENAQL